MVGVTAPRWLSAEEQTHWRAYLLGSARLAERLDRELRAAHGLSMPEYEILVRLSEAAGRRVRMAELATSINHSRSRLSHTIARLEQGGLVTRENCPGDRRGVFAVLTDLGFARLEEAARTHVEGVRRSFVDVVPAADFATIGRAMRAVADAIGPCPMPTESELSQAGR